MILRAGLITLLSLGFMSQAAFAKEMTPNSWVRDQGFEDSGDSGMFHLPTSKGEEEDRRRPNCVIRNDRAGPEKRNLYRLRMEIAKAIEWPNPMIFQVHLNRATAKKWNVFHCCDVLKVPVERAIFWPTLSGGHF